MTRQLGYQVEIFNKEESLGYFKSSNYEDCRINAYPSFTSYHGINRTLISFLMVDLDLKDFAEEDQKKKAKAVLGRTLNKTLQNIKETTGGNPPVLWIFFTEKQIQDLHQLGVLEYCE
jgi:hypothetical protein